MKAQRVVSLRPPTASGARPSRHRSRAATYGLIAQGDPTRGEPVVDVFAVA